MSAPSLFAKLSRAVENNLHELLAVEERLARAKSELNQAQVAVQNRKIALAKARDELLAEFPQLVPQPKVMEPG